MWIFDSDFVTLWSKKSNTNVNSQLFRPPFSSWLNEVQELLNLFMNSEISTSHIYRPRNREPHTSLLSSHSMQKWIWIGKNSALDEKRLAIYLAWFIPTKGLIIWNHTDIPSILVSVMRHLSRFHVAIDIKWWKFKLYLVQNGLIVP